MVLDHEKKHNQVGLKYLDLRATPAALPTTGDDDIAPDADEPPDQHPHRAEIMTDFHRWNVVPHKERLESLLTKALHPLPAGESFERQIHLATDMSRRQSTMSNASAASTAELTSDEGVTSPARTNTPSPPLPQSTYLSFAPYALGRKAAETTVPPMVQQDPKESLIAQLPAAVTVSKPDPAVEALVKKRCITFACGGQKPKLNPQPAPKINAPTSTAPEVKSEKVVTKRSTIKFACPGPKATETPRPATEAPAAVVVKGTPPSKDLPRSQSTRSPSLPRKLKSTPPPSARPHRDLTSTARRAWQSPAGLRIRKPTYVAADEESLRLCEATRFHEFASDEYQDDDWIRKDNSEIKEKLTISDTLKKENAIRQLGKEVEDEVLQDEEEGDENGDDSDAEVEDEDEEEEEEEEEDNADDDGQDDETIEGSEFDGSDGNETDNEAGFAESDDESDTNGDYQFWTPGRSIHAARSTDVSTFRSVAHIAASESSIDSLKHMSPIAQASSTRPRRAKVSRRIKIRPGTPDLPDSTDFVCGTLDEDRPLEDAYVSCMKARNREKHHPIPQDIDPSFPTSDPEEEEEDNAVDAANDSDEHIWLHGRLEDLDEEPPRRRRHSIHKSPNASPKRLHSPPPPKHRLRSPPPRRLFNGLSPRRMRSPPPARHVRSPAASPTGHATGNPISFAPLGHRPGLTHTKSLPRTPNVFSHRATLLDGADASNDDTDTATATGHTRGAIDIVKGLEHKRQRRKEKLNQKICNRARRGLPQRKPQPGKGAERMRDLGLQLAGKIEDRNGPAEYVISL